MCVKLATTKLQILTLGYWLSATVALGRVNVVIARLAKDALILAGKLARLPVLK